jgi:hypothetical protein
VQIYTIEEKNIFNTGRSLMMHRFNYKKELILHPYIFVNRFEIGKTIPKLITINKFKNNKKPGFLLQN